MKASELIEQLQSMIRLYGDYVVVDEDDKPIGAVGWELRKGSIDNSLMLFVEEK